MTTLRTPLCDLLGTRTRCFSGKPCRVIKNHTTES